MNEEKRVAQLIYLRPSLRTRIDMIRAVNRESRSSWIERAVEKMLEGKHEELFEKPPGK